MANNKSKFINNENISRWLSALGFSFPRNQSEEKIFDKVYSTYEHQLIDVKIDAMKLISEVENESSTLHTDKQEWKMAARNYGDLPKHIIDKMKKNQNDKKGSHQKD